MRLEGRWSSSSIEASLSALESSFSGEVAGESSSKLGGRIVIPILTSAFFAWSSSLIDFYLQELEYFGRSIARYDVRGTCSPWVQAST